MMRHRFNARKLGLLAGASLVSHAMATAAHAQGIDQPTPPEQYTLDPRGVDLVSGSFNFQNTEVVIGQPGQGGLAVTRGRLQLGWRDSNQGSLQIDGSTYTVVVGLEAEVFTLSGGTFTPTSNSGATLSQSGTTYTLTTASGVVARYTTTYCYTSTGTPCTDAAVIYEIVSPNGETINSHYLTQTYVRSIDPEGNPVMGTVVRLQSITNNRGYRLQYVYNSDSVAGSGSLNTRIGNWLTVASVTGANNAVDYCDPTAVSCTYTHTWPSVAYSSTLGGPITAATDQSGRATQFLYGPSSELTGIRYPGSSTNDVSITQSAGRVTSVVDATGSWNYTFTDSGSTRTAVSTGPNGQSLTVVSDLTIGRPTTITNALGQTQSYQYDTQGRLTRTTNPEGDYVEQTLDARGNVTQVTATPKPGSGLAAVSVSTTYASTCANPVTCNLPTATTDARGNVTDYTWDGTHGGPLTITAPAPTPGAARPQTRYAYASQTAYYKDSTGVVVPAPSPVTLPTEVSACATGSNCAGGADEVRTTIAYGPAGETNNLLPTSISQGSGTTPAMTATAMTWTPDGDVETIDGPLPGTNDTTRYRYDTARQPVGVIGPDPDGGGPLLNRAQRLTYDGRGQVTKTEAGTTAGQSDGAWASFSPLLTTEVDYDVFGRPITMRAQTGAGATFSLQQVSYDASGRPECSVQRMNPAFASPPSACTASAVAGFGPDRIARATYDAASRMTAVTSGLGTAAELTESASYSANGQPETLTDGNGNTSTMVYDGFDRLSRLRYPNPAGGGASTSDYEEYTYDAGGNVLTARTRANATFTATYDALNRTTLIDAPAGTEDIAYTHDNLDRLLTTATPSQTTTMTWDALSRMTSQTGLLGTMGMQYDAADRRTRLTWPDAFFVEYDYDLTDAMVQIRQGGSSVLAAYAYDDLGRRIYVARGNGVATSYSYDSASRLSALNHDLAGAASDQSYTYQHNPAGQITGLSSANNAYAYAPVAGTTGYQINGLNQTTAANATPLTYDANGNLISDGTRTFTYDAANRLIGSGSAALNYDALGRLYRQTGSEDLRYVYDGVGVAGFAANGTTLTQRFVIGPWPDEIVANVAGSNPANLWLQDHLGSTIAITNPSGAAAAINAYDEYGQPRSGNAGRLQYTGQVWMGDFGVYHYKARAYHPGLGRFLQTDPIGYAGGANLYAYVGGDPVNWIDPLGLQEEGPATPVDPITAWGRRCRSGAYCITIADEIRAFLDSVASLPEIVVTGSRSGRASGLKTKLVRLISGRHAYNIQRDVQCSAGDAFEILRGAGNSAPGAPYARENDNPGITIFGGNPITQNVNVPGRTIVNSTEATHLFHRGDVRISVQARNSSWSRITVSGTGTGRWPFANEVVGYGFFGTVVENIENFCADLNGGGLRHAGR